MNQFIDLHAASAFSFLEAASVPEEMAEVCAQLGMPAMAILDRDGVYSAPRFHMAAKKFGLKAHIGAEVTCLSSNHPISKSSHQSDCFTLPLIAATRTGYQNLCRLITRMKMRPINDWRSMSAATRRDPKHALPQEIAARANELAEFADGLICLTGSECGPLAHALRTGGLDKARRTLEHLIAIYGRNNVYVELQRHYQRDEESRNQALIALAREFKLPLIASNGPRYARPEQRQILDVLTCVREHRSLDTAGRLLACNSERYIKSPEELSALFADLPEALANAVDLSSRLEFTLNDLGYEFPRYPVPEGDTMMSFLRKRTQEGFENRYGRADGDLYRRARRQVERELALIEKLDLPGYFLIVWDIVRFCREQNILAQGRGSAANSAVCYSLGITAVDPVGMDLLFERFLSEERGEWPDIDIDLPSGEQRERAIQYVYQRYGKLGAAMTANVITYRGRSAAREIGKALGFDGETLDRLSSMVGSWEYKDPSDTLERQFRDAGFDLRHPRMMKYMELCLAVQDLPRHLGQHSGGMVVCQGQLDSVVPLEPASMPGRVVVQWDKEDCADMGIIKVDLLGLGMMAVLEDSIDLIRTHYEEEVDLAHLPADDPDVYAAIQKADTVGMFQIESRAQMSALPRVRPEKFYDLVVQVAIIRPGPIVGGMVNPFIKRRQGREVVTYPHPSLEPVLARTLGVPLFQEQLLRIAMITAGFSGGEAEELRRAMGFKRSEKRMREIEAKLRSGMTRNGIDPKAQEEIIQSIVSFALYGFPESHSASFALLAYASAYLKTHYLAAFTAALLNNQPMGFYHPSTIVKDAQRHGLKMLPIDVLKSDWMCTIEEVGSPSSLLAGKPRNAAALNAVPTTNDYRLSTNDHQLSTNDQRPPTAFAVRLGLRYVRGLREETAHAIVERRRLRAYASIDELARRVPELHKNELVALAEIGALNRLGVWQIERKEVCHPERSEGPMHFACTAENAHAAKSAHPERSEGPAFQSSNHPIVQSSNSFHRRDALWQVERAARHPGPLLDQLSEADRSSPLMQMTPEERLVADFHGTGLTVGSHPMAYRRAELNRLRIRRACELASIPNGRRVRIAGCVIARQRPGTASGFVFLSLEDETGISNAIIRPDLFEQNRLMLVSEQFLMIEGVLQNLDDVISVRADRVVPLHVTQAETSSHDFH
ncbi:MAG TPA: error-prone DNA polymerase [Terriglobales bacterium]|nr:error-prone DNA polymerase [Terriglobales bacterium]